MKYYLGIDGGGSKTDFKVIDENGNEKYSLTINSGCKPDLYGIESCLNVLDEGINQVKDKIGVDLEAIYAGISGCGSDIYIYDPIRKLINKYAKKTTLKGDLLTNFRALSKKKNGVALLAGTGSAIAHWYDDGCSEKRQGSISYGSRETLFLVADFYKNGKFKRQTADYLDAVFGQKYLNENSNFFVKEFIPSGILEQLNENAVSDEIWEDLKFVFTIIANRWAYKAIGEIRWHYNVAKQYPEVVISGGLWSIEYIRESVTYQLEDAFGKKVNILYNPNKKAVDGAAILAKDL